MEWMILPYKRYFDFSGRSQRMEYWMFTLFTVLVTLVLVAVMFAGMFAGDIDINDFENPDAVTKLVGTTSFVVGAILLGLFWLGTSIPSVSVNVRRFHDRDMSGWWFLGFSLAGNLPYVGWLISIANIVIMAMPGTRGANRFGDDPKDPSSADVFS